MPRQIPHPFLLFITNTHESKWYKVTGTNQMEKLGQDTNPKATFSDNEGHSHGGGASGGNKDLNNVWDEETRQHLRKSLTELHAVWKAGGYEHLVITGPAYIKNNIATEVESLSPDLTYSYIPGNFTHENLHDALLEKIHRDGV